VCNNTEDASFDLPPSGSNCMTYRQAPQDYLDTIKVSLHKNNKINLPVL
jgi:hypothetical protein